MSYERRDVVGGAVPTTLSSGINSGATSFAIAVATGWPTGANGDFFVVIDRGTANEEKIRCASRSTLTVTVQTSGRGSDGTSGVAHDSGAAVEHCITAVDVDEANYAVVETVGKVTTAGDLLVGDGTNSLARLGIGTTGHPLVAGASTPAYGQVGTSGIADDAITSAKIATDAVGSAEIAADAVGTSEIAADSVGTSELADDAVATANIATGAVTADEIGALAVTATKLHSGVVDDSTLEHNSGVLRVKDAGITIAKFASGMQPIRTATSAPSSPVAGQQWYDTDDNLLHVYNGTAWVCITPQSATVATTQTSSATSYADLGTVGPAVTVTTDTEALVTLHCAANNTQNALIYMGVAVSGATTVAASDANATGPVNITALNNIETNRTFLLTGLTAGANVFTAKYKHSIAPAAASSFLNRDITVVGIP